MKELKKLNNGFKSVLKNEEAVDYLKSKGLFLEFSRLALGVDYLSSKGVGIFFDAWTSGVDEFITSGKLQSATSEQCLLDAELTILHALYDEIVLDGAVNDGVDKKTKKGVLARRKEMLMVASEIMPDCLARVHGAFNDHGLSVEISEGEDSKLIDLKETFEAFEKYTQKSVVVNNLPTYPEDVKVNYRKLVKQNTANLLQLVSSIHETINKVITKKERGTTKRKINAQIRKFRRDNRPVNKNGEFLPSYLDFINAKKSKLTLNTFEQFKQTPTHKVNSPFKTQEEYNAFVTSSEFAQIVECMETPVKVNGEQVVDGEFDTFELDMFENAEGKVYYDYASTDVGSDFSEPKENGFSQVCKIELPKELVVLSKEQFKLAKKTAKNNETVVVEKNKNVKLPNILKRVAIGVVAGSVLFSSVAPFYKFERKESSAGVVQPKPQEPSRPEVSEPELDFSTIEPNKDNVIQNPAESIEPGIDNLGPGGTIYPEDELTTDSSTDTTVPSTPDSTSKPQDTTVPEETNDTDNVLPENPIDSDRETEKNDDEFWF